MSRLILSPLMKVMFNDNKVVVGNSENGGWMKIPADCYQILKMAEEREMSLEELMENIHEDDRIYFETILTNLKQLGVLIDKKRTR